MDDPQNSGEAPARRVHAIVHGLVQGVNFRAYTVREARRLGLTGWVRNKADGTVETIAEGSQEQLSVFIDFLHTGSPSAHVRNVEVTLSEAHGDMDSFSVQFFQ